MYDRLQRLKNAQIGWQKRCRIVFLFVQNRPQGAIAKMNKTLAPNVQIKPNDFIRAVNGWRTFLFKVIFKTKIIHEKQTRKSRVMRNIENFIPNSCRSSIEIIIFFARGKRTYEEMRSELGADSTIWLLNDFNFNHSIDQRSSNRILTKNPHEILFVRRPRSFFHRERYVICVWKFKSKCVFVSIIIIGLTLELERLVK